MTDAGDPGGTPVLNDSVACLPHPGCDLCGAPGGALVDGWTDRSGDAPGRWQLLRCPECGLVWLNPRPLPSEIGKLYPESYFTLQSPRKIPGILKAFRRAKQPVIRALHSTMGYPGAVRSERGRRLGRTLASVPGMRMRAAFKIKWAVGPPGRMVDVGCGSGDTWL